VVLSLAAEASAETVFDWVLLLVLPGLSTDNGRLRFSASNWRASALPPVAVWVAVLVWLALWLWLQPEPPVPSVPWEVAVWLIP